jgi:hypothetical protein
MPEPQLLLLGLALAALFLVVSTTFVLLTAGDDERAAAPAATDPHEALPTTPAPDPDRLLPLQAFQQLRALRAEPGVKGLAFWGPSGALVLAEGEEVTTFLPEASRLLDFVRHGADSVGGDAWLRFVVEGVGGTVIGFRSRDHQLVVAATVDADLKAVEAAMYRALGREAPPAFTAGTAPTPSGSDTPPSARPEGDA